MRTLLSEQNKDSKIYDGNKAGSWDYFRKTFSTGVVLVHEAATASLHLLPALFDVISTKAFSFWCISSGETLYPPFPSKCYQMDHSTLGKISATRLFPQGVAMLLTPSLIVADPLRAYNMVKHFNEKQMNAIPGTWKLVCAGNICNYLLDLAISKADEKDAAEIENQNLPAKDAILNDTGLSYSACEARFKLHNFFARLQVKGMIDGPIDSDGFDHEFGPDEKDTPVVQADIFVDPDDEPALIEWFAAWSMRNLDMHRKFVVFGTGPASARRAHRMKEFVSIPGLDTPPDESKLAENLQTPDPKLRPFSITKGIENAGATGKSAAEAKDHAHEIAARLTAARPQGLLPSSAPIAQQDLKNKTTVASTTEQSRESPQPSTNNEISTAQLRFCIETGGTVADAKTFLARSNNDLKLAIELHQQVDAMDISAQIDELIVSAATGNDQSQGGAVPNASSSNISTSATMPIPQVDGADDSFLPQYDGGNDRPGSSGSSSTTRSGIVTNENGQRFVPRSVRPDNSIRKERAVRPGFSPKEDMDPYVSPRVAESRGNPGNSTPSATSPSPATPSRKPTSIASPTAAAPADDRMDIDGGNADFPDLPDEDNRPTTAPPAMSSRDETAPPPSNAINTPRPRPNNVQLRKHIFKDTVSWYEEYKRTNGSGWEHIFVGTFDEASKKSGLAPTK